MYNLDDQPELDGTVDSNEVFNKKLASAGAINGLGLGHHIVDILKSGDFSAPEQFKLVRVLLSKLFQRGGSTNPVAVRSVLDLLKSTRTKTSEFVHETFWEPYFRLVASNAAEIFDKDSPENDEMQSLRNEAMSILEEVHELFPLAEIEEHRFAFAIRVKNAAFAHAGHLYKSGNRYTDEEVSSIVPAVEQYGVKLPTRRENAEALLTKKSLEFSAALEELEGLVGQNTFGSKFVNLTHELNGALDLLKARFPGWSTEIHEGDLAIDVEDAYRLFMDMFLKKQSLMFMHIETVGNQEAAEIHTKVLAIDPETVTTNFVNVLMASILAMIRSHPKKMIDIKPEIIDKMTSCIAYYESKQSTSRGSSSKVESLLYFCRWIKLNLEKLSAADSMRAA